MMSVLNEYHIDIIHMVWLLGITQQFADLADVADDHFVFLTLVIVYGVFLTPCTGMVTPCTGLRCVPHPMYWSMVCSSPHVLV